MGATQKPRTPTKTPAAAFGGVQDVIGDNMSNASLILPTDAQDVQNVQDAQDGESEDDDSPKYPAEHFFKCNWYSHRRWDLAKLLEEGKCYSYAQIERMLSGR